jgi:hypothetical protein
MKNHFLSFIFIIALSASAFADLTINSQTTSGQRDIEFTLKFGSDRARIDSQMSAVIMIPAEQKMIVLMPQMQQYMVMQMPSSTPTENAADEVPQIIRTGKHEVINGFECEQILLKTSKGTTTEMWVSKQGPSVTEFAKTMAKFNNSQDSKMGLSWLKFIGQNNDLATYPIRVINYDSNGAEMGRMTVSSFSKESVPVSEFSPPAGFTEQKMPAMPGFAGASGGSGSMDMDQMKKIQEQMMKGGRPTPEQIEQMKKMAEQMKQQMQQQGGGE